MTASKPLQSPRHPPRRVVGKVDVLLLWPNLVCYVRLALSLAAAGVVGSSLGADEAAVLAAAACYFLAMLLDGLDGALARVLVQQTEFGSAADVLVDNAARGAMWVLAAGSCLGAAPLFLEMLVFACTHKEGGAAWKSGCFAAAPRFVAEVMRDGFRTPLGAFAVAGLHFLPLWICLARRLPSGHPLASPLLGAVLALGRCLGLAVELWVAGRYFDAMLSRDAAALSARREAQEAKGGAVSGARPCSLPEPGRR